MARTLDEALLLADKALKAKQPLSIGLLGNCAEVLPEMARRGVLTRMDTDYAVRLLHESVRNACQGGGAGARPVP